MSSIINNNFASFKVTVAPLVLLSVLDHYKRINTNSKKRCLGVILGDIDYKNNSINITNSFAIPFEEDDKNSNIWFLDHNYIENMYEMFKKINAKEKLLGWYHTGPKLSSSDSKINEVFKNYSIALNNNPILLIVDVLSNNFIDLPTNAYMSIEQVMDDGTSTEKTFINLSCSIKADEAEEIGVEHLLRDVRNQSIGNLSVKLTNQLKSLKNLKKKLTDIVNYLNSVIDGKLPINHNILGKLQDIFNLLPDFDNSNSNLNNALTYKTNDELMMIYISNLIRAIIAFDNLIENKIKNKKLLELENNTDATKTNSANSSLETEEIKS